MLIMFQIQYDGMLPVKRINHSDASYVIYKKINRYDYRT